jgi:hypothetical protein
MRCMVPQPFARGGNRSYLEFWVITDDPWYPGYKTPTRGERRGSVIPHIKPLLPPPLHRSGHGNVEMSVNSEGPEKATRGGG